MCTEERTEKVKAERRFHRSVCRRVADPWDTLSNEDWNGLRSNYWGDVELVSL